MSTTQHSHLKPTATETPATSAESFGGSVHIAGSVYVYTGLTLGSGVDVTNGGNTVFVEQGAYLTNYGTVSSTTGAGVSLFSGATLTNDGTVTSNSGAAVSASGGGTYIDNIGTISSVGGSGVSLSGDGTLMNAGGITSGASYGITASAGTAAITNYGSIGGNVGVSIADGTITNAGTITGASYAVTISGTGTLVDDAGSVFNGQVAANAGGGSVLDLAGSGYGTLAGLGTQFTGFGTLAIESGTWTVQNGAPFTGPIYNYSVVTGGDTGVGLSVYTGGFLYNAAGATITANNAAAIVGYGSSLTIVNDGGYITSQSGPGIYLTGSGTIDNYGGTISSASGYGISQTGGTAYVTNTGYIGGGNVGVEIAAGTITNSGTISGGSYAVTITGEGTLVVDPGAVFYGQVAGTQGYGDVLDLAGSGYGTLAGLGTQFTGFDTLTVTSGTWAIQGGAPSYGLTINNYSTVAGGLSVYSGSTLYNAPGATITATGTNAVSATGTGISLDNYGTISATGGAGIYLSGYGTIANDGGTISGTYGIDATGGAAYVTNDGTITGTDVGVAIAYGTITNAGTISGGSYAVTITGSGTVIDDVGSVFSGTVAATAGNGSILDLAGSGNGTLAGLGTQFTGFDTLTITSGTWTVQNGAAFYGVINNYSVVTGGATGVGLSVYSNGSLYNASGAQIISQGAAAVSAYGSYMGITNDGLIAAGAGFGIYLSGSGSITNAGTIISTYADGIGASGGNAYVTNTGTIIGGNVGVYIGSGTITNDGTITGGNYAVYISGTGTLVDDTGSVFNGQVAAAYGGGSVLDLAGTGNGTLAGLGTQFTGFGTLDISSGTWTVQNGAPFYGAINNYATVTGGATGVGLSVYSNSSLYNASGAQIISQGAAAVSAYGSYIAITNDGLISAGGGFGIYLSGSGSITNDGTISSTYAYGIGASGGNAYITNYGTITGGNDGVSIVDGTITNDGTIIGGNYAVYISGTGTLVVGDGAAFYGQVAAYPGGGSVLDLAGTGYDTLTGLGTQFTGFGTLDINAGSTWTIENGGPFYGVINNYGVVTGGNGVGLSVYSGSTLYNAYGGTITSSGAAGIVADGTGIIISNDGVINSDGGVGIYLNGSGTITNYNGTITSGSGYGIAASGGTAIVTNYGYIGGGNVGVQIQDGTITNAGTIMGGNYAVEITGTGTLIVEPTAVFYGQVAATPGYGDVLELSGSGAATLAGFGTQFTGFSTVAFDAGTDWTLDTNIKTANTTTFTGNLSGATLDLTGGGALTIAENGFGTLELSGSKVFTLPSALTLSAGELLIDAGSKLGGGGKLSVAVDDSGTLQANKNAVFHLAGEVTGTGMLSAQTGGTLALNGGFDWSGGFSGPGTIALLSAGTVETSGVVTAAAIVQSANVKLAAGVTLNDKANTWTFNSGASSNAITLAAGSSASKFATQGTINAIGAGTTYVQTVLTSTGQINVQSGTLALLGTVANGGTMSVLGGSTLYIATSVTGTGLQNIGAAGKLDLAAGDGKGQLVDFLSSTGSLELATPSGFLGTITGFGGSDVIDLLKTTATGLSFANNTLKVLNGGSTVASLHFATGFSSSDFTLTSDGHGGDLITFK